MKDIVIGLLWQSPKSSNLGLAALAHSNLAIVQNEAAKLGVNAKFVFFSAKTPDSASEDNKQYEFVELSRDLLSVSNLTAALRKLNACDVVFDVGEGDSFSDIYGWLRFSKITAAKFLVRNARQKLVLSPQTLGPFKHPVARFFGGWALARAGRVFARDALSYERARGLMNAEAQKRLMLTTDMAFALPVRSDWPSYFPALDEDKIHVGLNVSGLLYRGGYTGKNQFNLACDYKAVIDQLASTFAARPECKLWLVPHVHNAASASVESDRAVSEAIAAQHPGISVAPPFQSASDAKTFISKMSYFSGARMHATIAAISTGTPCIPMSYSPKFEGLYNSIGYEHVLTLATATTETAIEKVLDGYEKRDALGTAAAAAAQNAVQKLSNFRSFVAEKLAEVAGR